MSMKDLPEQEEKLRKDSTGEVQEVHVEVQLSQPLSKYWRYATCHSHLRIRIT